MYDRHPISKNRTTLRAFLQGGRVTLLGGLPFSIVFRFSLYMSGRVTLGLGSPYHLGRVTLLVGLAVCLPSPVKALERVTLGGGLSRRRYELNNVA